MAWIEIRNQIWYLVYDTDTPIHSERFFTQLSLAVFVHRNVYPISTELMIICSLCAYLFPSLEFDL